MAFLWEIEMGDVGIYGGWGRIELGDWCLFR